MFGILEGFVQTSSRIESARTTYNRVNIVTEKSSTRKSPFLSWSIFPAGHRQYPALQRLFSIFDSRSRNIDAGSIHLDRRAPQDSVPRCMTPDMLGPKRTPSHNNLIILSKRSPHRSVKRGFPSVTCV